MKTKPDWLDDLCAVAMVAAIASALVAIKLALLLLLDILPGLKA